MLHEVSSPPLIGPDSLGPRQRVADEVYELVVRAVLAGELAPGSRLSVPALAARLGVSRTPVREAIQRLVREGLAVEEPHRGAVIASFGTSELVEIYELREVLEGLAARLAAERISEAGLADLRAAHAEHRRAIEDAGQSEHTELDMRFHGILRDAAGNAHLAAELAALQSKIRLAMLSTSFTAGPARAVADHEAILAAVAARDPDEAERVARAHIARLTGLLRSRR